MRQKNLFLTGILSILFVLSVNAQRDYSTGIGLRGGPSNGITVKHFLNDNRAVEGILSTRWQGFVITGLYEIHQNAFNTTNFNFYYGFGGHLGFWDTDPSDHPWFNENNTHTVLGIDGIVGLEYTFDEIPFNLSLDWKPGLNLVSYTGFWADELALSVRFAIK